MKPLILTLKKQVKFRLDASFLTTNKIKNFNEFKSLKIAYGKRQCKLTDLFSVRGEDIKNIILKSSTSRIDNIGLKMKNMNITIFGNAGNSVGREMSSGTLKLYGNSLDYTGAGITGGSIFVYGNAGKFLCGKPIGKNEGILDGLIYVNGSVGNHSVQRMRRGIVVINGNLGNYCCNDMISGSIIVKGKIGKNFCDRIKRGTIITTQRKPVLKYLSTNSSEINFFKFYIKQLSGLIGKKIFSDKFKLQRFHGSEDNENLSEVFLVKQ